MADLASQPLRRILQRLGVPASEVDDVELALDEIKIYATEAALLAATHVDGVIGYAEDTDNYWFRRAGAWTTQATAGEVLSITSKTANYTATATDHTILVDATAGVVTITLPAAATNAGREYAIKKIDASANAVTIDANGAELIDGAATQALATQWKSMIIQCNGTAWFILAIL